MITQVVNLQAELAYTQARLAILQRLPLPSQAQSNSPPSLLSSAELASAMEMSSSYNISMHFDPMQPQQLTPADLTSSLNPFAEEVDDGDLRTLAREFVSKYLPGVKIRPSSSD